MGFSMKILFFAIFFPVAASFAAGEFYINKNSKLFFSEGISNTSGEPNISFLIDGSYVMSFESHNGSLTRANGIVKKLRSLSTKSKALDEPIALAPDSLDTRVN